MEAPSMQATLPAAVLAPACQQEHSSCSGQVAVIKPQCAPFAAPAGELVPKDEASLIAQHLSVRDRLSLAATCKQLLLGSQHWFPEIHATLSARQPSAAGALAAWLRRHSAAAHVELTNIRPASPQHTSSRPAAVTAGHARAALLPLGSPELVPGVVSLSTKAILKVPTDAAGGLASLTRLELPVTDLVGSLRHLSQLQQLRHLRFMASRQHTEASWQHLSALTSLQSLRVEDVPDAVLASLVAALPGLAAHLTSLAVSASAARPQQQPGSTAPSWRHLAALSHLQFLDLRAVPGAADVPRHLAAAAAQLQHLLLPMCRLEEVPPAISTLTALKGLHLGDNSQLRAGLEHLAPLAHLQALRLDGCPSLPPRELDHLASLPSCLEHLSIEACDLQSVPPGLAALTALTGLALGYNLLDGTSFRGLQALGRLRELDVRECLFTAVPVQVSTLTALTSLGLGSNRILSDWDHLRPLTQLQSLDVFGCDLAQLPSALSVLVSLTALLCSFNAGLSQPDGTGGGAGWEHLQPLKKLQSVDCHGCRLAQVPAALAGLTTVTWST